MSQNRSIQCARAERKNPGEKTGDGKEDRGWGDPRAIRRWFRRNDLKRLARNG